MLLSDRMLAFLAQFFLKKISRKFCGIEKRHYLCSVIKRTKEPERVLEERIKRLRITTIGNKDLKGPLRRAPRKTITKLEIKIQ